MSAAVVQLDPYSALAVTGPQLAGYVRLMRGQPCEQKAGNYNQVNKEDRGLNQNGAGEPVMGRGRAMAC